MNLDAWPIPEKKKQLMTEDKDPELTHNVKAEL